MRMKLVPKTRPADGGVESVPPWFEAKKKRLLDATFTDGEHVTILPLGNNIETESHMFKKTRPQVGTRKSKA